MSRVPKLRFKEFSGEWEEKKFGDIYSFHSTNSFSRDNLNYEQGNIRNIHYGDIHTKFSTLFKLENESVPFINPDVNLAKIKEENYCLVGDLVIADASEDYNDIGKSIEIISLNNEKALAGLHTFLARPNKHKMALGFVGSLLKSWNIRKQIMTIAQGTKILSLSSGRLSEVTLHIPSILEQQKIASFLSAVDTKIDQLTRKKELLEQYKKGVMQKIFSQELRFKADDGSEFPEWEEKKLGEIGEFRGGGTPSKNIDEYWIGAIPWISSSDIVDNNIHDINISRFINEKAIQESATKIIPPNSVLFVSRVGVGKIAVSKTELCTSQDFTNFIPTNCLSYFLGYFFLANKNVLRGFNQGTSIKGFTKSDLETLVVNFPCFEEQTKIANFLSAIDTKIDLVTKQLDVAKNFKKGLLQQMFV